MSGVTPHFTALQNHLISVERFLKTLYKLEIITKDEMRVIYSSTHFKSIERLKDSAHLGPK